MTTSTSMLFEFKAVTRLYGKGNAEVRALDRVDLSIARDEFVAIMGPSGSGKSTCLNLLGCLDLPTEGELLIDGQNIEHLSLSERALLRRHRLGFVFQGFNLLARTSALENVELPLVYQRISQRTRRKKALEALELVGLTDRTRHTPAELSGGQKQRVAIARALVTEPDVLLADEPTGNLDSSCGAEIMGLLAKLHREKQVAIVLVTHELEMAGYADRKVVFRDGAIELDEDMGRVS